MAKARVIGSALALFSDNVVSGPGLNLIRSVQRQVARGDVQSAESVLKRASMSGQFAGKLEAQELRALRSAMSDVPKSSALPVKDYKTFAKEATREPLVLDAASFPSRMADQGFVPLTGVNLNRPSVTLKEFTGPTRERFIDEGAQNLMAAWNMDPAAARAYSSFYPRTYDQLAATGVPIDRVGGAWATLSAQAEPTMNAELLRRVLQNPEQLTTSRENQLLALRFLSGAVDDPAQALGMGKRYNFMQNSIDPTNPNFLTADTRYAQNLQGVLNAYGRAPFAGMFQPRGRRYQDIYAQPGFEGALRMGVSPSELQAGSWGNWRNRMSGIETDLSSSLMSDLADFPYDPQVYRNALQNLGGAA